MIHNKIVQIAEALGEGFYYSLLKASKITITFKGVPLMFGALSSLLT